MQEPQWTLQTRNRKQATPRNLIIKSLKATKTFKNFLSSQRTKNTPYEQKNNDECYCRFLTKNNASVNTVGR